MARPMLLSLILAATFVTRPAAAIDGEGSYFVRGIGNEPCSAYGAARRAHRDAEFEDWLAGYESAFNRWTSDVWNIETDGSFANSLQWLDYYCAVHPVDSFGIAAQNLTIYLYPSRQHSGVSASLPQGGAGATRAPR